MADLTDQTTLSSLGGDEWFYVVDDPSGTPVDRKISADNVRANLARTDTSNTFTGSHKFGSLLSNDDTAILVVSGGESTNLGGNIQFYGDQHSTDASQVHFREDATTVMVINDSKVGIGDEDPDAQLKIAPLATTYRGLRIDMPTSTTANCIQLEYNTANRGIVVVDSGETSLEFLDFDNGTGTGPTIQIGKNSNATTPVPGALKIEGSDGTDAWLFPEGTRVWRTGANAPASGNGWDSDTIVGTQTSRRAMKDIYGPGVNPDVALKRILSAPVYEFTYKHDRDRENPDIYHGIVTDEVPEFGWDEGRAFNPVNFAGYAIQAIKALNANIEELQAQIAELRR